MWNEIPPCILDSHLYRVTNTRCRRIGTVFSPDDGHVVARNMHRKTINILRTFVHQVGSIYKITFFSGDEKSGLTKLSLYTLRQLPEQIL